MRFLEAAQAVGLPLLADLDDPRQPVGAGAVPGERRRRAALERGARVRRPRPWPRNLEIAGDTLVDRVLVRAGRADGVVAADGRRIEAGTVVLAAGAYFTPAILMRSGIGPEAELRRHGIDVVADLPVGERLLDHCGDRGAWSLSDAGTRRPPPTSASTGSSSRTLSRRPRAAAARRAPGTRTCSRGRGRTETPGRYEASIPVFHMKPRSAGRVRLRSPNPDDSPLVERGFLQDEDDVRVLVEGIELARSLAAAEPLRPLLAERAPPGR